MAVRGNGGVVRFGWSCGFGSLHEVAAEARRAEEVGFDSVWWLDHTMRGDASVPIPEAFVTLASILAATERVTVGPAVTDLLRRHPAVVAHAAASLEQAYPGRFVLGVGAGNAQNLRHLGLDMENLPETLIEGLDVMRSLLDQPTGSVNYEGKFFTLRGARIQTGRRETAHIPLYLAALGPRMLKLAARIGQGWLPLGQTPVTYERAREALAAEMVSSGRSVSGFDFGLMTVIELDESGVHRGRAVQFGREFLAKNPYASKSLQRNTGIVGPRLPYWDSGDQVDPKLAAQQAESLAAITEEAALSSVIYGSADACVDRILEWQRCGCTHMVFMGYNHSSPAERLQTLNALGRDVLPRLATEREDA